MFKRIMEPLLEAQNGLYCAVLADMEGELIARVGLESAESDAAALFAAHQGIIFTHMAAAGADMFRGDCWSCESAVSAKSGLCFR